MGSVSATSGPDTELQVPDEILQNFGMKTSFSKDVPKLPNVYLTPTWDSACNLASSGALCGVSELYLSD